MSIRILPISTFMALCLISCSSQQQDDPVMPDPVPDLPLTSISFGGNSGTWQDAPISRANENGLENLYTSFRVWGYKNTNNMPQTVMEGYDVEHDNDWYYTGINNQTVKYWDYSASDYRFCAYTPANADITAANNDTEPQSISFTIPYNYSAAATAKSTPYVSDLWHATPSSYGNCVTMTFAPIIAKVRFRFSYPDGTESIDISDIQFRDSRFIDDPASADTPLKGSIIATYPIAETPLSTTPQFTWINDTGPDDTVPDGTGALALTIPYEEENATTHISPQVEEYGKWYFVPPYGDIGYQQGAYTITANIEGKTTSATVPAAYMQWRAGYQYTYIFKITATGSMISFSDIQVEEWIPGSDIDNNGNGTEGW